MENVLQYGKHALQTIKVFNFDANNQKTYVFIHGGGWRDPNNTYNDFETMIDYFKEHDNVNAIGINYRLSPEFKHPTHLLDIVSALNYIGERFTKKITLVGHSVGATLILQLFDSGKIIKHGIADCEAAQCPFEVDLNWEEVVNESTKLRIRRVYLIDGIYDIVALQQEYAEYSTFIDEAFVSVDHYKNATQLSNKSLHFGNLNLKETTGITIVQSVEDELISLKQTNLLVELCEERGIKYELIVDKFGKHEQVYRNRQLAEIIVSRK